jgi:probable rRNA maturation factor
MAINIQIDNSQKLLRINKRSVKEAVQAVLQSEDILCKEVSLYFVDEPTLCDMHANFFDDPSPTDCISFPIDGEEEGSNRHLGEIFISTQAAIDYAAQHQTDPYEELMLYVVHGLLHLIGYDDIKPKDRASMRVAEKRLMHELLQKNISFTPAKNPL